MGKETHLTGVSVLNGATNWQVGVFSESRYSRKDLIGDSFSEHRKEKKKSGGKKNWGLVLIKSTPLASPSHFINTSCNDL